MLEGDDKNSKQVTKSESEALENMKERIQQPRAQEIAKLRGWILGTSALLLGASSAAGTSPSNSSRLTVTMI